MKKLIFLSLIILTALPLILFRLLKHTEPDKNELVQIVQTENFDTKPNRNEQVQIVQTENFDIKNYENPESKFIIEIANLIIEKLKY